MESTPGHDPIDQLLGGLDRVLDTFHDRVVRPLLIVTRFLAFSSVLLALGIVLLVAFVIGLLRFGNVYVFHGLVWLTYLVVGTVFLITGLLIWRRRNPAPVRKS